MRHGQKNKISCLLAEIDNVFKKMKKATHLETKHSQIIKRHNTDLPCQIYPTLIIMANCFIYTSIPGISFLSLKQIKCKLQLSAVLLINNFSL